MSRDRHSHSDAQVTDTTVCSFVERGGNGGAMKLMASRSRKQLSCTPYARTKGTWIAL